MRTSEGKMQFFNCFRAKGISNFWPVYCDFGYTFSLVVEDILKAEIVNFLPLDRFVHK
jgi:hypothetical protein